MVGARSSTASSGGWSSGNSGEVVPVGIGRGGGVCELREVKAELIVGSAWVDECCRGWSAMRFELVGAQAVGGCSVLGFWARERARQGGESDAGLLQVLGRARVGVLGLCAALATAAARWRPRGWPGWRGEGSEAPARGKEGGVESGHDAWETTASRRWPGPSTAAGGTAQRRRL